MTKRKCELLPMVTLLPPCKRPLCAIRCTPDIVQVSPVKKRKLEPETGPPVEAVISSPECETVLLPFPAATPSPPPCKKLRAAESPQSQDPPYKCQKDEAFPEYNSFQYWRIPLPDVDFSELSNELSGVATSDRSETDPLEEMDS